MIKKSCQEQKSEILATKSRKAQEEMVGFGLIIIIVAIILLVFLWFSLANQNRISSESAEVESFIHSLLQYTSECEDYSGNLAIKDLIFYCFDGKTCENGPNSCEILNLTVKEIINQSWQIGANNYYKGYSLNFDLDGEIIGFRQGNLSGNSRGAWEEIPKRGKMLNVYLSTYY